MMASPQLVTDDKEPVKPGLPLLLPAAIGMWLACACVYGSLAQADGEELVRRLFVMIAAAVILGAACMVRRVRPVAFLAASVVVGVAFGLLGAAGVHSQAEDAVGKSGTWTLVLTDDCTPAAFGSSAYADATGPDGTRASMCVLFADDEDLKRGQVVSIHGTPRPVKDSARDFYWSQGIATTISVDEYRFEGEDAVIGWALRARATAIDALGRYGGDQAGLMQALACGYRPTFSESGSYEDYKTCGLAHLVAVSGAHLALVVALFRFLLDLLRVPKALSSVITVLIVMIYLVFAGVPLSAVRAAIMVLLALSATAAKRRSASLNALALCIIVFIAAAPPVSVSASFCLSVGSTLGILLFAGLISSWFSGTPKTVREVVIAPLGMTLSSNIATLPYSAALFSQVPLIAPVANVVATPLFMLACIGSLVAALIACIMPATACIVVPVAAAAAYPLSFVVALLADIPFACVAASLPMAPMVALSHVSCVLLWIIWPRLSLKAVLGAACSAVGLVAAVLVVGPLSSADEIVMVDVGQGDAFLVRSQGRSVLIDTGNKDSLLREGLGRLGVHHLDAVIISHPDDDHCGSLVSLSGYVGIDMVIVAEELLSCPCDNCSHLRADAREASGREVQGLNVGDSLAVGIFTMDVIWPDVFADEGGNGDSLCLLVEADCDDDGTADQRAVFLGDAECDETRQMIGLGRLGDVDVLKVGHHGSKVSLAEDLMETIDPEIALISCGKDNQYGHPSDEVLSCLSEVEHVIRSDRSGTVSLCFSNAGIEIREEHPQRQADRGMG